MQRIILAISALSFLLAASLVAKPPAKKLSWQAMKLEDSCSSEARKINSEGIRLMAESKMEKAQELFSKSILKCPQNPTAYGNRGTTYFAKDQFDDAVKDYEAALSAEPKAAPLINPMAAKAYIARAKMKIDQNKPTEAEDDLNRAKALDPKNALVFSELAYLAALYKKFDLCLDLSSEAVKLNPALAEGWSNRGACYTAMSQLPEALRDLNKALALQKTGASYLQRGMIYAAMKSCALAKKDLALAVKLNPPYRSVAESFEQQCSN